MQNLPLVRGGKQSAARVRYCSLAARQNSNKRIDVQEVHETVFVAIRLFDINPRCEQSNKRRDVQKVHYTVEITIPKQYGYRRVSGLCN